jgi:enoyl-CoA hydratase
MSHVTITESDGVAVLAIDRPPANAMNLAVLQELVAAIEEVAADPPRAIVVTGREGFFSGGVDLKAAPDYGPDEQRQMVDGINRMALGVYGLRCPVVGAITGHAIAGGMVLAVCTDIRVVSIAGRYGLTEIKVGIPFPQAAIGVVRAELAPHAVRMLVLSSQLVSAEECLRLGVFDEMVEPDAVLPRALEIARGLAEYPAEMYARTKDELRGPALDWLRNAAAEDPLLAGWLS